MLWPRFEALKKRSRLPRKAGALRALLAIALASAILSLWLIYARPAETPPSPPAEDPAAATVVMALVRPGIDGQALMEAQGLHVVASIPEIGVVLVQVQPGEPLPLLPDVERWELPAQREIDVAAPGPGGLTSSWSIAMVGADKLPATAGQGVVVAVVDTGVAPHPDLADALEPGFDATTGGALVARDDPLGHGTHVAGIIASRGRNGAPRGVAPAARILPVRVFRSGSRVTDDFTVARGIVWAMSRARVINLSLGSTQPSTSALQRAVHAARDRGEIVVASAGNCAPR
jgi:subtilisin family serine protease